MYWLVRVLIRERRLAAQPRVRGQRVGVEILIDVSDDAAIETHVLAFGPRHDSLADNVKQAGAVIVVSPVPRSEEELADLDLDPITHLQGAIELGIRTDGGGVVEIGLAGCRRGVVGNEGSLG